MSNERSSLIDQSSVEIVTEAQVCQVDSMKLEEGISLIKNRKLESEDKNLSLDVGRLDVGNQHINTTVQSIDFFANDISAAQNSHHNLDQAFFEEDTSLMEGDTLNSDQKTRQDSQFNISEDLSVLQDNNINSANHANPQANNQTTNTLYQTNSNLNQVNTNLVGWVYKHTQQKSGSKAWINVINQLKSQDMRIMTINESLKVIIFINKGYDTKKIPYSEVISISISPRNSNQDIVIETSSDWVYLNIVSDENGLSNICTAYGWYLAFKSTTLTDRTIYDVYKYKNIDIEDLKVYKFNQDKIKSIMQMPFDEKKKVIQQLADKLFDYQKINESLNKNQFFKCIKLISNNIFTTTEIDLIYQDLVNRSESKTINEQIFTYQCSEMISLIIEKMYT